MRVCECYMSTSVGMCMGGEGGARRTSESPAVTTTTQSRSTARVPSSANTSAVAAVAMMTTMPLQYATGLSAARELGWEGTDDVMVAVS